MATNHLTHVIAGLHTLAVERGLTEQDLDDLVHDCADHLASEAVNTDPRELPIDQLQDEHYGTWSQKASEINNSGMRAQVSWLVEHLGLEQAAA